MGVGFGGQVGERREMGGMLAGIVVVTVLSDPALQKGCGDLVGLLHW